MVVENSTTPDLSIVIPVVERYGDLHQIFDEYREQVRQQGLSCEFIFVVDHRQRSVVPTIRELLQASEEHVKLIVLGGEVGESASLTIGFEHSRGELIMTVPSYFQVAPDGLGAALHQIQEGADLVVGRRYPRTDSVFNRLQTRLFHGIVSIMTRTRFHDISCGFRVLRREVANGLSIYGGQHRFLPVLAHVSGFNVVELSLEQRPEDARTRYYGVPVYLKRLLDILTVFFLSRFTHRPLRFFGPIGLTLAGLGSLVTLYLGTYRVLRLGPIAERPLLLLGALLIVLGIQILSLGLIGELVIFTHARSARMYRIAKILESAPKRRDEKLDDSGSGLPHARST